MKASKRPYGVRAQDWAAQQQWEYQKKVAPPEVSLRPVLVQVACPCSFRPYPHIIPREINGRPNYDYERHQNGAAR